MSDVGYATLPIIPSLRGAQSTIERDLNGIGARAGRRAGQQFGRDFSQAAKRGINLRELAVGAAKLAAASALFYKAASFLKKSFESVQRIQRLNVQTATAVKSTGGAANVTAKHVEDLTGKLENLTATEAESIQVGANFLLTFTNIRNEAGRGNKIFDRTVVAMTDMSRAMDKTGSAVIDTQSASLQLGKALNDPIRGVTALQRVGVSFTAQQKAQIKTLVESGKTLSAQKIILREVEREFGGSGAAFAKTSAGQFQLLGHAVGTFGESIAQLALPALTKLATKGAQFFNDLATKTGPALQPIVDNIAAVFHAIAPIRSELFATFGSILQRIATTVGPILQQLATTLGPVFVKLAADLQPIVSALGDALVTVIDALAPLIPPLAEVFGQLAVAIGDLLKAVAPLIPPLTTLVTKIITPSLVSTLNVLAGAVDVIAKAIEGWARIVKFLAAAFEQAYKFAKKLVNLDFLKNVWGNPATDVLNKVVPLIKRTQELKVRAGEAADAIGIAVAQTALLANQAAGVNGLGDSLRNAAVAAVAVAQAIAAVNQAMSLGVLGRTLGAGAVGSGIKVPSASVGGGGGSGGSTKTPFDRSTLTDLVQTATGAETNPLTSALKAIFDSAEQAGKKFSGHLVAVLTNENDRLKGLVAKRESIARKLADAKAKLSDAIRLDLDERATVSSAVSRSFDITSAGTGFDGNQPVTFGNILAQLKQSVVKAKRFSALLKKLSGDGLPKALLQQLAEAGPAALPQAQALASATPKELGELKSQFKSLTNTSTDLGKFVGDRLYKAGVDSARGLVAGLESQESAVVGAIARLADKMVEQIKRSLKIASPSRVTRALGKYTGQGFGLGLRDEVSNVESHAKSLANAAIPNVQARRWQSASPDAGPLAVNLLVDGKELASVVLTPEHLNAGSIPVHLSSATAKGDKRNGRRSA